MPGEHGPPPGGKTSISLDEAFLDLSGTQRLHKKPPAVLLAELTDRIKNELGLTGSIGLSHNKFLVCFGLRGWAGWITRI